MLLLEKIDEQHRITCQSFSIQPTNEKFFSYIPVEISDGHNSTSWAIRKGKKAKLLLISGKQKIYLPDAKIIETILSMKPKDVSWFLLQFVNLYNGVGQPVFIKIADEQFDLRGIASYPDKKELLLFSDSVVDYSVFCHLLNFVFCKDACWEKMSNTPNFGKQTLFKYILLISCFYNKSEYSRDFLNEIKYPIEEGPASNSKKAVRAFNNLENIEKFDISHYI